MQQQKKGFSATFWVILVLVALIVLAGVWYFFIGPGKDAFSAATPTTTSSAQSTANLKPTIIYSEEVAQNTDPNGGRQYPTVKIYRKVGSQAAEELVTVGKIGEYPNNYLLSPDKNYLLINLESKLQILNLKTKQLGDLFTPRKQVGGIAYSPNGKNLFIWDQAYASNDKKYSVHNFEIATKKDSVIKEGTMSDSPVYLDPLGWRDDNKVVLMEPMGEIAATWIYDLGTNLFTKTSNQNFFGTISNDYKIMSNASKSVDDVCNGMSGSSPSLYSIIDTSSGQVLGTVGLADNISTIETFSPKNDEILFSASKSATASSECSTEPVNTYYTQKISAGSQPEKVANPESLLAAWHVNYTGAQLKSADGKSWTIKIGNNTLVSSTKSTQLIAQYYR